MECNASEVNTNPVVCFTRKNSYCQKYLKNGVYTIHLWKSHAHSVQFSSVSQSWPTLCDPMNRSTPGLPVHHQLPEFIQTHIHRVNDAIQPSHPLSSPSPPSPNPSQHQGLFQSVMPSNHLILCRPLLLLPPIPPSIRVFSNESTLHMRWPKYWSFSFSIIPSKEIPGLALVDMIYFQNNCTN